MGGEQLDMPWSLTPGQEKPGPYSPALLPRAELVALTRALGPAERVTQHPSRPSSSSMHTRPYSGNEDF